MKNIDGIKFKVDCSNTIFTIKDKGYKDIKVFWGGCSKTKYSREQAVKYLEDGTWTEQRLN